MSWRNAPLAGTGAKEEKESQFDFRDAMSQAGRQLGLTGRSIVTGVTGLPGMAADATMAALNLALPQQYQQQMPSAALQGLLTDIGLPEPETRTEQFAGMVQSALTSGKIPMPTIGRQAPPGFEARPSLARQTFDAGRQEGYVVPPASVRPGIRTRLTEGLSGKVATQQEASIRNQEVTNRLAAQALGLPPNEPITPAALKEIRDNAGRVYAGIRQSGPVIADDQYKADLVDITKGIADIAEDFKGANVGARDEIFDLIKTLNTDRFNSNAAVSYIMGLRDDAAANLKSEGAKMKALGRAQKKAAAALENAVLRHLRRSGMDDLAEQFAGARALIAKSYDVEEATNLATGNVRASALAKMIDNQEPLTGELATIGKMGATFPKAMQEIKDSPGVSALDIYGSLLGTGALFAGGGGMASLAALGLPLARMGARSGILSEAGQNVLTRPYTGVPGRAFTGTAGLLAAETEEERRRRTGR